MSAGLSPFCGVREIVTIEAAGGTPLALTILAMAARTIRRIGKIGAPVNRRLRETIPMGERIMANRAGTLPRFTAQIRLLRIMTAQTLLLILQEFLAVFAAAGEFRGVRLNMARAAGHGAVLTFERRAMATDTRRLVLQIGIAVGVRLGKSGLMREPLMTGIAGRNRRTGRLPLMAAGTRILILLESFSMHFTLIKPSRMRHCQMAIAASGS